MQTEWVPISRQEVNLGTSFVTPFEILNKYETSKANSTIISRHGCNLQLDKINPNLMSFKYNNKH